MNVLCPKFYLVPLLCLTCVLLLLPAAEVWIQQHWELRGPSRGADHTKHSEGEPLLSCLFGVDPVWRTTIAQTVDLGLQCRGLFFVNCLISS